jgi:phage terminase large subunit-like protein
MYAVGEESVAEMSHKYAIAQAEGRITDPGFLFDHRQAGDIDFDSDDELRAALVDVYGEASAWIDVERLVAEARDPQTHRNDFERYFLNKPSSTSQAWLSPVAWNDRADPDYRAPDGTRVVLAFDGSYRLDSSALIACTVEERPYLWVVGLWERPEKAPADWTIDRELVDAIVRKAMDTFDVAELACDPPGWHAEITRWRDSYGEDVVLDYPTATRTRMAAATSLFYSAVMNGQLAHDGDPRLTRHIANATLKETAAGAYITKQTQRLKIDAAVAAVVAHERARWHYDNPRKTLVPMVAWA